MGFCETCPLLALAETSWLRWKEQTLETQIHAALLLVALPTTPTFYTRNRTRSCTSTSIPPLLTRLQIDKLLLTSLATVVCHSSAHHAWRYSSTHQGHTIMADPQLHRPAHATEVSANRCLHFWSSYASSSPCTAMGESEDATQRWARRLADGGSNRKQHFRRNV